jgi:hypothetical protein
MSISLNYPVKPTAKTIRLERALKGNNTEWLAWWYGGMYKNTRAESQPNVVVCFRELVNNNVSDHVESRTIPLTALGQVTIGSIWKDSVCKSAVDYDTHEFEVDFRRDGWRFTSFNQTYKDRLETPYPRHLYPLQYTTDKNWLLEFKLASGGKLIVPCLEFFSRCYGRSQELKRILATYPWQDGDDNCIKRFYAPLDEPEEEDIKWKVKLRMQLRNGDTTFLAHARYDLFTKKAAKSIYSQLDVNFKLESTSPMFIEVPPWFQGPAEIRVKGIWFDNKRSFLALGIVGCSDPDGILIERERENTNKRDGVDADGTSGEAWAGSNRNKLIFPPDIVDLTGDAEPDHGTESVEVLDNDFVVLGIPRFIVDRYGKRVTDRNGARKEGEDVSAYSSGERHGTGKGVGYASIHAQPVMESQGALMDMWNAVQYTKAKYPDKIQSVDWYTFQDGYKAVGIPGLIGLEPINELDEPDSPKQTRNWVFYDVATKVIRGVMVIRMVVEGIPVHIIEIQRRPRKKKENGKEVGGEESYKGFIVIIKDSGNFLRWLKRFLSDVRYKRGIVDNLVTRYGPGKFDAFAHSQAGGDQVRNEAAVLNALKKMDIILKRPK